MRKRITIVAALLALLIVTAFSATAGAEPKKDPHSTVEQVQAVIAQALAPVEAAIESLGRRLAVVEQAATADGGRLKAVEQALSSDEGRLSSLEQSRTANEARLSSLEVVAADAGTGSSFWPERSLRVQPSVQVWTAYELQPGVLQVDFSPWVRYGSSTVTEYKMFAILHLAAGDVEPLDTSTYQSTFAVPRANLPADGSTVSVEYWVEYLGGRVHATVDVPVHYSNE